MVAFGSAVAVTSGVPSSKQKFRLGSVYVRLQVGQRFIYDFNGFGMIPTASGAVPLQVFGKPVRTCRLPFNGPA